MLFAAGMDSAHSRGTEEMKVTEPAARRCDTRVLEQRGGFEALVLDLVSTLVSVPAETLDGCIRDGLRRLAEQARVERSSLARFSDDGRSLTVTHSSGVPAIATPFRIDLRWYLEQVRQGHCMRMNRLPRDLPSEASAEREVFRRIGVRAHVAIPLFSAGRLWGIIGLDALRQARRWAAADMGRFRVIGEIMMAAVRRRELEEAARRQRGELIHVARLATLSDLTVALTHELNQPLTAIRANAQATRRLVARGVRAEDLDDALRDIVDDATRAADLIRRLDALLRRRELERSLVDVNQVVRDLHTIARMEAERHGAKLVLRLASDLPRVNGDPVQLQQVLLNLVRNAAEAMASVEPGARDVVVATSATVPRQVTVSVADAGTTIDDAVFNRLFTPFHTTKTDGLGMGLTISRSIVEAHGGRLWVERRARTGLVIHFTLPAETSPATSAAPGRRDGAA
jgi:signal transduction histidine kinase